MTRSDFFKRLGLGAIACMVAPKIVPDPDPPAIKHAGEVYKISTDIISDAMPCRQNGEGVEYFYLISVNEEGNEVIYKFNEHGCEKVPEPFK